jgi:galactose mutarotase-like enzyme/glycosyltransferase involved in cell wall biosynthesis
VPNQSPKVVMALQFWPRGGSAQVVRYLAPQIVAAGWPLTLVTGSLGGPGDPSYAPEFYAPLEVSTVDYTPAMKAWDAGDDPLAAAVPLHPSFEDREGAPDRIYASLSDDEFEHQVAAWSRALTDADLASATVAHLHHLTPINEAVHRLRPELPQIVSLHGTEMLMLEAINAGASWPFAKQWGDRLREWAAHADRLIVVSPTDWARAEVLFEGAGERLAIVPHGVDPRRFQPLPLSAPERMVLLEHWLVDDPQGWDESGVVGSVRYETADLAAFAGGQPVLMFVGRFTDPKRLPLLLRAYARARRERGVTAPLLVWGGFPGEWEGEHPVTVVRREGIEGVFFTGWHGHDELPTGLGCADVFVSPSVGEAFGQVFLEAMACGLPVVAAASGGPLSFVNVVSDKPNGWLVPPDDEASLVDALVDAASSPGERALRAANAVEQIRAGYSWSAAASQIVGLYERAVTRGMQMTSLPPSGVQIELRHGSHHAVVVEAGGGLRSYTAGGVAVLDGYPEDEMASGGRGQVLFPWPNRLAGGTWDDAGSKRQLPLSEVGAGNAIHGLVRWSTWEVTPAGPAGATARHTLMPQPGYPFRLAIQIDYRLSAGGLAVTTTARNESSRTAPFGLGFHPYLSAGDGLVDNLTLIVPAETHLLLSGGIPTGREPSAGSGVDFRAGQRIGSRVIDDAFTDVQRGEGDLAQVTVDGPHGRVELWAGPGFEYLQVFTGDTLAPAARRRGLAVEPMTCPPNALATGEGLIRLEPGASVELSWGIAPAW